MAILLVVMAAYLVVTIVEARYLRAAVRRYRTATALFEQATDTWIEAERFLDHLREERS